MRRHHSFIAAATAGALAGLIATVPMTLAMRAMFRRLPRKEQYPLPPRQIVRSVTRPVGVYQRLDDDSRRYTARVAHLGFGTSAGLLYGIAGRRLFPGILGGMVYGTAVWTASYLGWLPAAGILPPATQMPARRNVLMIVAHWVWGGCAAALYPSFRRAVRM